jgi:hypothetical protein
MSATTHGTTPYYYVPAESRHPVMAAAGLFFVILGAGQWINGHEWGKYSLAWAGVVAVCAVPVVPRCSPKAKAACTAARSTSLTAGA